MRLINDIFLFKRWLRKIVFIKEKSGVSVKIPLVAKIKYNLLGFTDFQYIIFDLKHNDHTDYISMWERYRLESIDGEYASLLGQKLLFARTFGDYINIPNIFCWISKGRFIDIQDGEKECDICSIIQQEKALIAKPNHSVGGGKGVFRIDYKNGCFMIDSKKFTSDSLVRYLSSCEDYLIVKYIESHEYSKNVYPGTANTIRIVTVMNESHDDVDVLFAFHRFGTEESAPVDNMSKGGLFAYIDETSGTCGMAKQLYKVKETFSYHPDTGAKIDGLVVPGWKELIEYLKASHLKFPFYEFFAWDVVISADGTPYIIEINRGSDLSIQVLCPMRKKKLGQYMSKKGLLDKR